MNEDFLRSTLSSLAFIILVLRDTYDAYKYGDGDRLMRNAKFELLLAHSQGHYKYRLWLYKTLSMGVTLTPKQFFEFKWNQTSNTQGGVDCNLPNDNLVEIQVGGTKNLNKAQGANLTYKSAQMSAKASPVITRICDNLKQETGVQKCGKHGRLDKSKDIQQIAQTLYSLDAFDYCPGRHVKGFENFVPPYKRLDSINLYKWLKNKKMGIE